MSKKGLTSFQKEYAKQLKRINKTVAQLEKQGFFFEKTFIPEVGKRISKKKIEQLKAIKPKYIKSQAQIMPFDTDDILSYDEYMNYLSNEQPNETNTGEYLILNELKNRIQIMTRQSHPLDYPIENRKSTLLVMLEEQIAYHEDNISIYVDHIKQNEFTIQKAIEAIEYGSTQEQIEIKGITQLAEIINFGPLDLLTAQNFEMEMEYV